MLKRLLYGLIKGTVKALSEIIVEEILKVEGPLPPNEYNRRKLAYLKAVETAYERWKRERL